MLLSLGKHQQTMDRLRSYVSRALTYPLVVLIGVVVVSAILSIYVLPQMSGVYDMLGELMLKPATPVFRRPRSLPTMPVTTATLIAVGPYLPALAIAALGSLLLLPPAVFLLRLARLDAAAADRLILPLPLIGPALRHSAIARFTHILSISVRAGVNLPEALRLSADTVGYPRLRADAHLVASTLESGRTADEVTATRILPPTLLAALSAGSASASLPDTLEALAHLHRQQAELRSQRIPLFLLPFTLLLLAALVALLLVAVVSPLSEALKILS